MGTKSLSQTALGSNPNGYRQLIFSSGLFRDAKVSNALLKGEGEE